MALIPRLQLKYKKFNFYYIYTMNPYLVISLSKISLYKDSFSGDIL